MCVVLKGRDHVFIECTPAEDFDLAAKLGAIINLDDISHIGFLEKVAGKIPETICCRFNTGGEFKISTSIMDTQEKQNMALQGSS